MKLIPILIAALLSGCASSPWGDATSGGAVYRYASGDCHIEIVSAREVGEADLEIGSDCQLKTAASTLGGTDAALLTIQSLVEALIIRGTP